MSVLLNLGSPKIAEVPGNNCPSSRKRERNE